MNVRSSPKEFNFKSTFFATSLLKGCIKNFTSEVAITEWGKNVSPYKKREIIVDRVPCKE